MEEATEELNTSLLGQIRPVFLLDEETGSARIYFMCEEVMFWEGTKECWVCPESLFELKVPQAIGILDDSIARLTRLRTSLLPEEKREVQPEPRRKGWLSRLFSRS